jgi:hypothetical protein
LLDERNELITTRCKTNKFTWLDAKIDVEDPLTSDPEDPTRQEDAGAATIALVDDYGGFGCCCTDGSRLRLEQHGRRWR